MKIRVIRGQKTMVKNIPKTEGIKYAGSKLKLLPHILKLAGKVKPKIVFDGFAGTTRVSQAFAQLGCQVISNDISVWSKTFGLCYLKNKKAEKFYGEIIEHLNNLPPKDGWFTENYGGLPDGENSASGDGLKKPFQIKNTRRLDAIRDEIEVLNFDEIEKAVLLTSLILALDKVDSTLGHYVSYLNCWSPRSFNDLNLKVPRLFENDLEQEVFSADVFDCIENIGACDLAYFDPPYGSNNEKMPPSRIRYAAYYHLWTSIILNDKPEVFGKAKRRAETSDTISNSVFEDFRKNENGKFVATEAIEKLMAKTNAKHIILSYSSGGRATAEELDEILRKNGKIIDFIKIDYKQNVMASISWTNAWTADAETANREYLFLLEKHITKKCR